MGSAAGVVVRGLRARQGEIERAVFARVREVVSAPADDAQYLEGLRAAVAGAVEFCLVGLERDDAELHRAGRSRERRLLERIGLLLAGGDGGEGAFEVELEGELGYRLEGEHLGVIARGVGARDAIRELALRLDRSLLCVTYSEDTTWAWLGGRRALEVGTLARIVSQGRWGDGLRLAVGESGVGIAGWRATHRQAQAASLVAARRRQALTRYGDVVLLAMALKDEPLARTLIEIYITPLVDGHDDGEVLLGTLRAYLAAERSVSSAAAALRVSRRTVESRLRTVEARLGRTLRPCPTELEVALLLDELVPASAVP